MAGLGKLKGWTDSHRAGRPAVRVAAIDRRDLHETASRGPTHSPAAPAGVGGGWRGGGQTGVVLLHCPFKIEREGVEGGGMQISPADDKSNMAQPSRKGIRI